MVIYTLSEKIVDIGVDYFMIYPFHSYYLQTIFLKIQSEFNRVNC